MVENQFIPALVRADLLAEINYRNVPNFKNIAPNFRDLAYDPNNKHTVPYSWGTTGLVIRSDLVEAPVIRWADMWDAQYRGRIAQRLTMPRYTLGATLLSLGYSVNSEEPAELEAALARLIDLKPQAIWLKGDYAAVAHVLEAGEAVMGLGGAVEAHLGQETNEAVIYVLPREGAILWGDNFVIPKNSPNKYTAELFLDFVLRPEISGAIINRNYAPMANEAASPFVDPDILSDPIIYPSNQSLRNAEVLLPLSPSGDELYADIWGRFLKATE